MTLDQLLSDLPDAATLKSLWLVFDGDINERLKSAQPSYQHQVSPIGLTDGRFTVCADLLTESAGIYAPTFAALDQSAFPLVQVVTKSQIESLFPIPTEE